MKRLVAWIPLALLVVGFAARSPAAAQAQDDGWIIRSFDVRYELQADGTFNVREDMAVDFGSLERHGIFRDMPALQKQVDGRSVRKRDVGEVE